MQEQSHFISAFKANRFFLFKTEQEK